MKIHRSNRADLLARGLASLLRAPSADPLEQERVVVSGRAAERWVTSHVAQSLGIAANIRFLSPSSWLEETLIHLAGQDQVAAGWSGDRLLWAIHRVLPSMLSEARFEPVAHYLRSEPSSGARAIGLARRIADAFERYVTTRPDVVLAWDAGEGDPADWQPRLWRTLLGEIGGKHLAAVTRDVVRRLSSGGAIHHPLPKRVVWFTHPSVPKLQLDLLGALAGRGVDVHLFVLTPSRVAVEHVIERAPALANGSTHPPRPAALALGGLLIDSFGRAGGGFELLVASQPFTREHVDLYEAPAGESMLATLQRDILDGRTRGPGDDASVPVDDSDASVRVHACHGHLRQVEVLRDELLRCFDELPGLQPRDVLVLCPALDDFAPLVDAVFSSAQPHGEGAPPAIPFRITDRSMRRENVAADVLLRLLAMASARVDAAEVLDLLAMPAVAQRFGFDESERERVRAWVRESGIRWGIDRAHRAAAGLDSNENSWRFGLDRMLVGQALPGDDRLLFAGVLPYDEIEGQETELLGRLAEACERVFRAVRDLDAPRTVTEWRDTISRLLGDIVDEDDQQLAASARALRGTLDSIAEAAVRAGNTEPLSLAAVRLLLEARFDDVVTTSGFGGGAVTFCSLLPGRTVTTRVVALLGMDDGVFPRAPIRGGFDLAAAEPRAGDADPAADDRQRLLEAIAGARSRLIVMYTGRTVDTNEEVPPCVPVGEFLEAIDRGFHVVAADGAKCSARSLVVREHPLQPFSPASFRADEPGGPSSYDRHALAGARRLVGPRDARPRFIARRIDAEVAQDGRRVVSLDDLARFFAEPSKRLLVGRLRVSIDAGAEDVETREPAELDALESWSLRDSLLDWAVSGVNLRDDAEQVYEWVRGRGALPPGSVGRVALNATVAEAREIAEAVQRMLPPARRAPLEVDEEVAVDGVGLVRLVGHIDSLWSEEKSVRRCRWQAGRAKQKHLVDLWVRHLALSLALPNESAQSLLVARGEKGGATVTTFRPVPDARERLSELLTIYDRGMGEPVPFFPEASRAYADVLLDGDITAGGAERKGLDAARRAYAPAEHNGVPTGEGSDVYVARAFAGREPFGGDGVDEEFRRLALAVFEPLRRHTVDVEVA